jgi:hypothetical protein
MYFDLDPMGNYDYPDTVVKQILDNFWSPEPFEMPVEPRAASDWYYFSGLCIFAYGCSSGAAIEKVMYIFHRNEPYETAYIPRNGDFSTDVAVIMDGVLTYKVTRGYGPPGIRRNDITCVATYEQDEYTPVNFDNGVWDATVHCTVPTRMDDWVFHRASPKEMQLNHSRLTHEQKTIKRSLMKQHLASFKIDFATKI